MIILQQIQVSSIAVGNPSELTVFHRRSSTQLAYSSSKASVNTQDSNGKWISLAEWSTQSIKDSIKNDSLPIIIGAHSLEVFNSFVLVLSSKNTSHLVFVNVWGAFYNILDISHLGQIASSDFDQMRKELFIVAPSGRIVVLAFRLVNPSIPNLESLKPSIQAVQRGKGGLATKIGCRAKQIVTSDVMGTCMVLQEDGMVICFDSENIEILWSIEPGFFIYPPFKLYADKFGSDFLIYCRSREGDKFRLEYWAPPTDFPLCNAGQFGRVSVPVKGELLGVQIETVSDTLGTYVIIVQSNRNAQLWKTGSGRILHECNLLLTGTMGKFGGVSTPSIRLPDAAAYLELGQDTPKSTTPIVIPTVNSILPCHLFFNSSASALPNCPFAIIAFFGKDYSKLVVHLSVFSDTVRYRALNDVVSALQDSNEADDFRDMDVKLNDVALGALKGLTPSFRPSFDDSFIEPSQDLSVVSSLSRSVISYYGEPTALSLSVNPEIKYFVPSILLNGYNKSSKNTSVHTVIAALFNPQLLISQDMSNMNKEKEISVVTRGGLSYLSSPQDTTARINMIHFEYCTFCSRSALFCGVTDLKEVFIFNLKPAFASGNEPPIRFNVDIPLEATITAFTVADVVLDLPSEPAPKSLSSAVLSLIVTKNHVISTGEFLLCLVGDSYGNVTYALLSKTAVITMGTLSAHDFSFIASLMTTGSCTSSIWNVASEWTVTNGTAKIYPQATAGSAIVTFARSGEVKVWQPYFTPIVNATQCRKEFVLSVYTINWKLAGTFCYLGIPEELKYSVSTCLDPTCLTAFVCYEDGMVGQWPLPGLMPENNNIIYSNMPAATIPVTKSTVWSCKKHASMVTSVRSFLYDADGDQIHEAKREESGDLSPGYVFLSGITNRRVLGYTLPLVRKYAKRSSMVTSSKDFTVILWRFMISDFHEINFSSTVSFMTKYLHPYPVRRICFSTAPQAGLCYPSIPLYDQLIDKNDIESQEESLKWTLAVAVKDMVVVALTGKRNEIMLNKDLDDRINSPSRATTADTAYSAGNTVEGQQEDDKSVSLDLSGDNELGVFNRFRGDRDMASDSEDFGPILLLPVLCTMKRPAKLAEIKTKQVSNLESSWALLEEWARKCRGVEIQSMCTIVTDNNVKTMAIKQNKSMNEKVLHPAAATANQMMKRVPLKKVVEVGAVPLLTRGIDGKLIKVSASALPTQFTGDGKEKVVVKGIRFAVDPAAVNAELDNQTHATISSLTADSGSLAFSDSTDEDNLFDDENAIDAKVIIYIYICVLFYLFRNDIYYNNEI